MPVDPGEPLDRNIYAMTPEEMEGIPKVPASLEESINALEADQDFLKQGGVFTQSLLDSWIGWKRDEEIAELALRPHPHEFNLYYDS